MAATQEITDTVFQDSIKRAVQEVFQTMLGLPATPVEEYLSMPSNVALQLKTPHVVGTVGFVGDINGLIYLYLTVEFAAKTAGILLDMDNEELEEAGEEVVNDAIGEITNVTVGTFKNQLHDLGYPCRLTIPSIMRGSNFTIEPISNAPRRTYHFDIKGQRLTADLLIQPNE